MRALLFVFLLSVATAMSKHDTDLDDLDLDGDDILAYTLQKQHQAKFQRQQYYGNYGNLPPVTGAVDVDDMDADDTVEVNIGPQRKNRKMHTQYHHGEVELIVHPEFFDLDADADTDADADDIDVILLKPKGRAMNEESTESEEPVSKKLSSQHRGRTMKKQAFSGQNLRDSDDTDLDDLEEDMEVILPYPALEVTKALRKSRKFHPAAVTDLDADGDDADADADDTDSDDSEQPMCGDGVVNAVQEQCDGADVRGFECSTFGFKSGFVTCTEDCLLSVAFCRFTVCGNNIAEDSIFNFIEEECDGSDLRGQTCATYLPRSTGQGSLVCTPDCLLDGSKCY